MEAKNILLRLQKLKDGRKNFDTIFQQVKDVVWPDAGDFIEKRAKGEKTTRKIYEMTAAASLDKFASAMESFLVPRHLRWHGLKASEPELNKNAEVKQFLEDSTRLLFRIREAPRARFYGQMNEGLKSLGAFGNLVMYLDEAQTGRGLRYRNIHVGRAWMEVDHASVVDTVYHEYPLTAKAAAQKWPDRVPERAALAIERGNLFDEHLYLHVVQPNAKTDPESVLPEDMPFHAWDLAVDSQEMIGGLQGFFEMPYLWSRYSVSPAEHYGRGPAMLALPDILTLQEMEKTLLRSGHRVVDPPLLVAHDGRMGRGQRQIRLTPGGLNYGAVDESGRPKIIPLQTGGRLDLTLEMMQRKQDNIESLFLVKLFDILAQNRVEMTATEVLERNKEKGQLITPVVGRQQSELLGPMIDREMNLLQRQGVLPPIPQALIEAGGELDIEYDSLATRMQQSDEIASYQRLVEVFRPQIELDPALAQVFQAEMAIREFGEDMGIRSTLFKSEDEMAELRKAQAAAAKDMQDAQSAEQGAKTLKSVSNIGSARGGA